MLQRIIIGVLGFGCCTGLYAADTIVVKKDPRLDILSIKQLQANQRTAMMTANGLYKGYRIQLASTPRRGDAFARRSELMSRFPDQKVYVIFQSPNFKVRIGNFLKKEDAEKFKAQLNKIYPQGVYIVEDGVEYIPKEEEENINQ